MIIIKRFVLFILALIIFINLFNVIDSSNITNAAYSTGSVRGVFYSRTVPIEICASYSYDESSDENSGFKKKNVYRIEYCTASCKDLDYSGFLNTTTSYTDTTIFVSVFGNLQHRSNSSKNFTVSETFSLNIS